jgi:Transposase IS116/IS110/IS902 family
VGGVDRTAIAGIDQTTALVLIAEIGPDLSRFPSAKHFCAWLGLCPQHRCRGGKVLSRRVRPGMNRAARALRLAAWSLQHSKSALGAYCRKLKGRLGAAQGIVAVAHKLARLVYTLLTRGEAYVAQQLEEYEQAYRQRKVKGLARQAQELGYRLEPVAQTGAVTSAAVRPSGARRKVDNAGGKDGDSGGGARGGGGCRQRRVEATLAVLYSSLPLQEGSLGDFGTRHAQRSRRRGHGQRKNPTGPSLATDQEDESPGDAAALRDDEAAACPCAQRGATRGRPMAPSQTRTSPTGTRRTSP